MTWGNSREAGAAYSTSAYSSGNKRPSRYDHEIMRVVNQNTKMRNNLKNVRQEGSNVLLGQLAGVGGQTLVEITDNTTLMVKGGATVFNPSTFKDKVTLEKGTLEYKEGHKHGYLRATKALPLTKNTNTDIELGTLPQGCRIVNLSIRSNAAITTGGTNGDDLDFSLGTAAAPGDIIDQKAIADDGGAAVTIDANTTYFIVKDRRPTAVNALKTSGIPNDGSTPTNPATSEAIALGANHIDAAANRVIIARFRPLQNDLAASGNVTVVLEFESI